MVVIAGHTRLRAGGDRASSRSRIPQPPRCPAEGFGPLRDSRCKAMESEHHQIVLARGRSDSSGFNPITHGNAFPVYPRDRLQIIDAVSSTDNQ
jgi:hypothetical protein